MNNKKIIRILKFTIIGLIIFTVILFALSMQTVIAGLTGAVGGDSFKVELDNDNPSGEWVIKFRANPVNNGLLGEKLSLSLGVVDPNGEYLAVNATSIGLAPGERKSFDLTLTIPLETVQKYNLNATETQDVKLELLFGIHTLGDTVGLQQTMRVGGGQEI